MTINQKTQIRMAYLDHDPTDGIYHLILNRQESRNALSKQMVSELHSCLTLVRDRVTRRSSVAVPSMSTLPRVLIIRGTGSVFCAGADLKERNGMRATEVVEFLKSLRATLDVLQELPIPTIAAIDGAALGGGLELALACDFRIAAQQVDKIGFPEVTLGVIPGAGGTQRAPRIIGLVSSTMTIRSLHSGRLTSYLQQKAKELIFTGMPISATEAFRIGLVDRVVEEPSCMETCRELATSMLAAAPLSLQSAKMALMHGSELYLDQGLDLELTCYEPLLGSRDRKEALLAFKEKRKPVFLEEK